MKVPQNLARRTESWRNNLLKKYSWFVALYCVYLKRLDAFARRKERRKSWQRPGLVFYSPKSLKNFVA